MIISIICWYCVHTSSLSSELVPECMVNDFILEKSVSSRIFIAVGSVRHLIDLH